MQLNAHIYKAVLDILTFDRFDSFSSNCYQYHNFYNLLLSSPGETNLTYESIERVVVNEDLTRLRFTFLRNFSTKRQIRYARILFFSIF